jgi:Spy/CpxP family protein refolding chaperone
MNTSGKNKIFTIIVVVLLIANSASMLYFWWNKRDNGPEQNGPQDAKAFIIKELELNEQQKLAYQELREEHQKKLRDLHESFKDAKEHLFDLLDQENPSDSLVEQASLHAAQIQQQIEMATFDHFKKLKALCNAEQKKKFDSIIREAIRLISPPPPPPNGNKQNPPPPVNGNIPPPPPPASDNRP